MPVLRDSRGRFAKSSPAVESGKAVVDSLNTLITALSNARRYSRDVIVAMGNDVCNPAEDDVIRDIQGSLNILTQIAVNTEDKFERYVRSREQFRL